MNAIETENLTKIYNNNFIAVNSLNLEIPKGTIFGMLGPNGAGKTTTIKMLTCLIQPTSGRATVGGYDVQLYLTLIGHIPLLFVCLVIAASSHHQHSYSH